ARGDFAIDPRAPPMFKCATLHPDSIPHIPTDTYKRLVHCKPTGTEREFGNGMVVCTHFVAQRTAAFSGAANGGQALAALSGRHASGLEHLYGLLSGAAAGRLCLRARDYDQAEIEVADCAAPVALCAGAVELSD